MAHEGKWTIILGLFAIANGVIFLNENANDAMKSWFLGLVFDEIFYDISTDSIYSLCYSERGANEKGCEIGRCQVLGFSGLVGCQKSVAVIINLFPAYSA